MQRSGACGWRWLRGTRARCEWTPASARDTSSRPASRWARTVSWLSRRTPCPPSFLWPCRRTRWHNTANTGTLQLIWRLIFASRTSALRYCRSQQHGTKHDFILSVSLWWRREALPLASISRVSTVDPASPGDNDRGKQSLFLFWLSDGSLASFGL